MGMAKQRGMAKEARQRERAICSTWAKGAPPGEHVGAPVVELSTRTCFAKCAATPIAWQNSPMHSNPPKRNRLPKSGVMHAGRPTQTSTARRAATQHAKLFWGQQQQRRTREVQRATARQGRTKGQQQGQAQVRRVPIPAPLPQTPNPPQHPSICLLRPMPHGSRQG